MPTLPRFLLLPLLALPLHHTVAQDVTATGGHAFGENWNQATWTNGQWSDGLAPSAGKTYSTGTFGIRTTDTASSTFGGDSLRVVTGGTLVLKQAYGNTSTIGTIILDGGTIASGTGTTGGAQQLVSGSLQVASDSTISIGDNNRRRITFNNGTFSGSGNLTITGGDELNDLFFLTSSMIGSHTGDWFVDGGRLLVERDDHIHQNARVTLGSASAAFFELRGSDQTIGSLAGNGTVRGEGTLRTLSTGGDNTSTTFSGNISNAGSLALTKQGSGTFTLAGANTFTGPTTIEDGTLALGDLNALQNTSSITIAGGATLRTNVDGLVLSAPITIGPGTATITAPAFGNSGGSVHTLTLDGPISGSGNLTLVGVQGSNTYGTIILGAQSTYTGDTLFTTDSNNSNKNIFVRLGADDALPTTTVLTMDGQNGAGSGRSTELNLNGFNQTLAGLTNVNRNLRTQRVINSSSTASTLTVNNNSNQTFSGRLGTNASNGNFSLTKGGSGTLTLSGNNTFSGATTINGGTLAIGSLNALQNTSSITIAGGATLRTNVDNLVLSAPITIGPGTATITAPAFGNSGGSVHTLTLDGPISGSGNLTLVGVQGSNTYGTIILGAQSTYTGNTLFTTDSNNSNKNIFVRLGVDDALPTTTVLTLDGQNGAGSGRTAQLDLNGFNQTLAGLTSTITSRAARNHRVTNSGALATLTIDNSADYTYGGLGIPSTFNGNPVNPSASITGAIALAKEGSGTFTLAGANSYTGGTTVSGGTLLVNNPTGSGVGSGAVTVLSGGTLGGTGFLGTANSPVNLTVQSGGTLSPGNSPGTLTLYGSALLQPGATFSVDILNPTTDLLVVNSGTVTVDGAILDGTWGGDSPNIFAGTLDADTMQWVIDNQGTAPISGTFANSSQSAALDALFGTSGEAHWVTIDGTPFAAFYNSQFNTFGSAGLTGGNDLLLVAIPEPSRALLLALASTLLLARRRRRPCPK